MKSVDFASGPFTASQLQRFSLRCRQTDSTVAATNFRMSKKLVMLALASMVLLALAVDAADSDGLAEIQKRHKSKYGKRSQVSSACDLIVHHRKHSVCGKAVQE